MDLYLIDKYDHNISISNQFWSCPQSNSSNSNQSAFLYDCVSNNLLNKSIYSPPIETLGNNF